MYVLCVRYFYKWRVPLQASLIKFDPSHVNTCNHSYNASSNRLATADAVRHELDGGARVARQCSRRRAAQAAAGQGAPAEDDRRSGAARRRERAATSRAGGERGAASCQAEERREDQQVAVAGERKPAGGKWNNQWQEKENLQVVSRTSRCCRRKRTCRR